MITRVTCLVGLLLSLWAQAAVHEELNIEYSSPNGHSLKLDLYKPSQGGGPFPVVMFIHGGGWKGGSKDRAKKLAKWLCEEGVAIAAIQYRLTDVAGWPAQIDDCYSAVRWLRRHAKQYGLMGERIGAWGTSAGGHLAVLLGTREYPGHEDVSSRVHAVCDWFAGHFPVRV